MTRLETDLESNAAKLADEMGWLEFRIARSNKRGVPDHLFVRRGRTVFVEFKRSADDLPSEQQIRRIYELWCEQVEAYVVHRLDQLAVIFAGQPRMRLDIDRKSRQLLRDFRSALIAADGELITPESIWFRHTLAR